MKVDTVEGAEAAQLSEKVRKLLGQKAPPPAAADGLRSAALPPQPAMPSDAPANSAAGQAAPAAVSATAAAAATPFSAAAAKGTGADLNSRLERLTRSSPVMLFMKVRVSYSSISTCEQDLPADKTL